MFYYRARLPVFVTQRAVQDSPAPDGSSPTLPLKLVARHRPLIVAREQCKSQAFNSIEKPLADGLGCFLPLGLMLLKDAFSLGG